MSPFKPPLTVIAAVVSLSAAHVAKADGTLQTNLVTDDQSAHAAQIEDHSLVNPWGVSYTPTSPFWVSNNGSANSTLYKVTPAGDVTTQQGLVVGIPGAGNVTGQAYNSTSGAFNNDIFLFTSEDGTISGWRGALGTFAETLQLADPNNLYKGTTVDVMGGHSYLLSANFRSGNIDVLKGDVGAPDVAGHFTDPGLPNGYAPFNVQNLGGSIFVAYAKKGVGDDEDSGAGFGFVSEFDLNGNFLRRVGTQGTLNAPWGLAIAPTSFGDVAGDLLVGNFGDGRINAFDLATGLFVRQLTDTAGDPLSIDGLWALMPGNGGNGGSVDRIYFTAGPDGETHGLFGSLTNVVPEPATMTMLALGAVALVRRKRG